MPDALINRTPAGWPYLDEDNYLDVIDNYTLELATKLQNSEADVAAAVNAAADAQASAATATSIAGALTDPNKIRINGVLYVRSGKVTVTPTEWATQNTPWIFVANILVARPYAPPPGWRFAIINAVGNGYTWLSQGADSGTNIQIRVLQIASAAFLAVTATWQLVPA